MKALNRLILAAAACMASLFVQVAAAQSNLIPKTIRLVVPFPPGNAADNQARALGDQLRKSLGLTVVVDNRPGASGAIALSHVAMAKPDGATLLVGSLSPLVVTPATNKALPYDTERDFAPIAPLGFNDVVLVAGPEVRVNSLTELIALAKSQPDQLTHASIGNGTLAHRQSPQPFAAHSPEQFAAYIRGELANWRAMAVAAGL